MWHPYRVLVPRGAHIRGLRPLQPTTHNLLPTYHVSRIFLSLRLLNLILMESYGEIILYQPNDYVKLEVRLEDETVWLNRQQLSDLFNRDIKTIGKHVNNALNEELSGVPVVAKFATVQDL